MPKFKIDIDPDILKKLNLEKDPEQSIEIFTSNLLVQIKELSEYIVSAYERADKNKEEEIKDLLAETLNAVQKVVLFLIIIRGDEQEMETVLKTLGE